MAITHGMDVGQVRTLASQLRQSASEIEGIISKITGTLQGTQWLGTDRTKFEGDWTGTYTTQLRNVVTGLNEAAQRAESEASQQEEASAT